MQIQNAATQVLIDDLFKEFIAATRPFELTISGVAMDKNHIELITRDLAFILVLSQNLDLISISFRNDKLSMYGGLHQKGDEPLTFEQVKEFISQIEGTLNRFERR